MVGKLDVQCFLFVPFELVCFLIYGGKWVL